MEHTHGEAEMRAEGGDFTSRAHMHSGPQTPGADRLESETRRRLRDVRDIAADYADRTRDRFRDVLDRAGGLSVTEMDAFTTVRRHPLASLGVAFSLGLVFAAATGGRSRHWMLERVRRQARTVLVSAVTAAIVSELHDMMGTEEDADPRLAGFQLGEPDLEYEEDYEELEM